MRTFLAMALLLGCCGIDTWIRFQDTREKLKWWGQGDPVSSSSKRIDSIRSKLPKRGTVSYEYLEQGADPAIVKIERLYAKYHLAPLIVTMSETPMVFLEDDGKTVKIRGTDLNRQAAPVIESPSHWIQLMWLAWACGLPFLAISQLLTAWSRSANINATPMPAAVWRVWKFGVSLGASLGLSSTIFSLWSFVFGAPTMFYFILESTFWFGVLVLSTRRAPPTIEVLGMSTNSSVDTAFTQESRQDSFVRDRDVTTSVVHFSPELEWRLTHRTIACLVLLVISLLLIVYECAIWNERRPDGIDDAIWIYNLRARFMHRSPDDWSDAFSSEIWHADYPLLLPASVARGWYFTESESVIVPISVSYLFLLGLVSILVSAASLLRGPMVGCLLGIVVLSTHETLKLVMSQIADVPFAYFAAMSVTSWVIARRWPTIERTAWLAFGISLGAAMWLKNEGITWMALGLISIVAVGRSRLDRNSLKNFWLPIGTGILPFLLTWAAFHRCYPTTSDIIAGQGSLTFTRLSDGTRHWQILSDAVFQFLKVGPGILPALLIYAAILGFKGNSNRRTALLGPSFMLAGQISCYYLVYLTSPHELKWHLSTSLERVFQQVWPATAYLIFLLAWTPLERSTFDDSREQQKLIEEAHLMRL